MKDNGIKEAFFLALKTNPSHAYLLLGEQQKSRETAMEAVAILLCENENEAPCGHCDSCRWYRAKSHPDFIHVAPDYTPVKPVIRIAQVRNLQEEISRQAQKKLKVIWIEDANTMNKQAQNACLKMLEEPPANVIFLLTGQEAGFLPTIRSRCNIVRLGSAQDTDENIPQDQLEKAGAVLTAFAQKNILQAQSLLTTDKKIFPEILQALIILVREYIADELALNPVSLQASEFITQLLSKNIIKQQEYNLWLYNELLLNCFEQQKHLQANMATALCIDALCINMNKVTQKYLK